VPSRNRPVISDDSVPPDGDDRVIPFRPRGTPRWRWPAPRSFQTGDPPDEDLAKYERGEGEDDYRHRMKMNLLALVVTILLVVSGVWIAETIAEMRKIQDCFLAGGRNCAPIAVPPVQRG